MWISFKSNIYIQGSMASCNVDSSPFHSYALEVGWGDKGERLLNFKRIYKAKKKSSLQELYRKFKN